EYCNELTCLRSHVTPFPFAAVKRVIAQEYDVKSWQEVFSSKELKETSAAALVTLRKSLDIPAHLADILKMTVKGQTKVNLEITGSEEPLSRLDSMRNMAGKLFGIPVLGAVGFLIAIILGGILMFDMLRKK
ncbi:MAG: hypothetical protein RR379_11665, partial [Clostridia bacterium]